MSARKVIKLVGLFRAFPRRGAGRPEPGAYIDALASEPYSLGTAYLKAYCDSIPGIRARYDIRVVNIADRSGGSREEAVLPLGAVEDLLRGNPAAVCFSGYCWNFAAALEACRLLKARKPSLITVLGGRPPAAAQPGVDVAIAGEAEVPLARWLKAGLRPDAAVGGPLADIDRIPSPYLAGILNPPKDGMMLELARGCPNDCGYCAWNSAKLRRVHSQERIAAELRWAAARGMTNLTIVDSAINYETSTLRRFVRALKKADPKGRLTFTYNLRYELLDQEQARWLSEIPSGQVLLGMETLSAPALRLAGRKPFDRRRFESALRLLRDIKPPSVGVILGMPGDTLAGFKRTMRYLDGLAQDRATPMAAALVSLLQVFPGTAMHRKARRLGLRTMPQGIPYLWSGPGWGRKELQGALAFLRRLRASSPLLIKGPEGGHTIASAKSRLLDLVQDRFPFLSVERHEAGSYVPGEVLVRCTSRCNQRCPFCSAPRPAREPAARELELAFKAAAELFCGAQFTLTGGEPTLRPELPALVRLLLGMKRFAQVRVQTNAVAFAKASYLKGFRPDPKLVFFVSLHALEPALYDELTGTRGMLPAAVRGLESLIAAGHRVIVNIVINSRNVGQLEAYSERLARMIGANDKVQVHFSSLTCPEHRPAAASYLVPYGTLVPELVKAMRLLSGQGIAVQSPLSATHASFPPCAVPAEFREEKVRRYRPLGHETGYEDFSKGYVKARACRGCAFDRCCLGLPKEYAARFGLKGCKPIRYT
ncbi:MAG: radical SAM protein [Elusimicrobia bacterium]|nr:radical SAM protein [Elusimicrobiota bacterium]